MKLLKVGYKVIDYSKENFMDNGMQYDLKGKNSL